MFNELSARARPGRGGWRVLLVEDDAGDARLIREHLVGARGLVAEFSVATNLRQALERLRSDNPDIALLDLSLPDATGLEALGAMTLASPNLPIVILTDLDDESMTLDALRAGAQDHLAKRDLDAPSLIRSVHRAVERMRFQDRAREAIRARDRVLGLVAHDLRNPLSNIVMITELLLDNDGPVEQRTSRLQIVRRSSARMSRLIEDLVDVVRIENGRMLLELRDQDPVEVARDSVEANGVLAAARSLTLTFEGDPRAPPILADRDRVMQVLSNLIGNAIKFTPLGGRIQVRVEPQTEFVKFSVEDNGPGIAARNLEDLFKPFWQGQSGGSDGIGLGLAIAAGIVEGHRGAIWLESSDGGGTTVSFTVPLAGGLRADEPPDTLPRYGRSCPRAGGPDQRVCATGWRGW